ncbi:serine hydrolase [Alphaproteobacteria bacterium GH1-50]|uniref:Serine hydrolase n=1 Tax=Kangsaoukella pontilimi TaxID=2691042 RepID=A0A7C9MLK1_9RHOB|nr:D-alanyl-D-alanine carboxypeptidase family protein [Kangsaoukella pontilimi]MXQ09315.1 serine hydrolase [Kangsaoukella pontilimi]
MIVLPLAALPAPYAAMVIDARDGKVLHSRNADTRLHPASLTKMMTLYVVFDAVEKGEIDLDTRVKISRKAASEPPSKLGLRAGSEVRLRHLIRAAAVKSANDAATALGEAISGSEAAFARRMNRMAKAMGMTKTTFKNAHGLTEQGHLSTARDMTTLGRHLFYDFPEYYNIFSRRSTDAGLKTVYNTNRRLLGAYRGADGIKTGYTRAAGFNLVASAERGGERVIATMFGGRSVAQRNARVAELLDMGFQRSPTRVAVIKPRRPVLGSEGPAEAIARATGLVERTPRPSARPPKAPAPEVLLAMRDGIADALAEVAVADGTVPAAAPAAVLPASLAAATIAPPPPRPIVAEGATNEDDEVEVALADTADTTATDAPSDSVVVTRMTTGGGRHWGINVGLYTTRHEAEKVLLKTALVELGTLDTALRKVERSPQGFRANFLGLTEQSAELACRRLEAQNVPCKPLSPS